MFIISTGILAPMFEEVIFRFYIQDLILGNTVVAIFISSCLFAFMHMIAGFSVAGFLTYMGSSVVIGILYMLSGGILFSAITHIVVNIAVFVMYYGDKLQNENENEI